LASFTRAAYAAGFTLLIVAGALLFGHKLISTRGGAALLVLMGLSVTIAVSAVGGPAPFMQTLQSRQNASQRRSLENRMGIWHSALELTQDRWLTGLGAGNFPMRYSAVAGRKADKAFVSRAQNGALQLFAERGLSGVAAFAFVILAGALLSWRLMAHPLPVGDKRAVLIQLAALVALGVREATDASVLADWRSMLLCWLLLASLRRYYIGLEERP
jgi:O-antigen ligase